MKNKVFNIIFASLFVLLLLVPLFFADFEGGRVSERENRYLATQPSVSAITEDPGRFIADFDAWISDNLGFRGYLIGLHDRIGKLESSARYMDGDYVMLRGEEGHHYFAYTDGWMIEKFQGKQFLSDTQLKDLAEGLGAAYYYLMNKEIPLIVMYCADKEEIYPEFYPKSIIRGPEPTQLDIITDYSKRYSGADVFSNKECLLAAKPDYPVFDKYGDATNVLAHYNEIGAFFSYMELMRHINKYMPEPEAFTLDDIEIEYTIFDIYPDIPRVKLKREAAVTHLDDEFFENIPLGHPSHGAAYENDNPDLPVVLIMRDSSMEPISKIIAEHFGKTILIHYANMGRFYEYIEYFNPDIVIFEATERELAAFANCAALLAKN